MIAIDAKSTKPRTRTDEERARDEAALLASGEPLATLPELSALFGFSGASLQHVLKHSQAPLVRYVRADGVSRARYAVSDVRAVVESHRVELEERRRRAEAQQAAERAASDARKAARAIDHAAHVARKAARARGGAQGPRGKHGPPPSSSRPFSSRRHEPEVVVVRKKPTP